MILILAAVSIWLPALLGLGSVWLRLLRRAGGASPDSVALRAGVSGMLGMFTAATAATAVNFLLPVYPWCSTALLVLGWGLAMQNRRRFLRMLSSCWRWLAIIVLLVSWIDARGLQWYDTGLYHLQAVQWMTTTAAPAGLANLDSRLGFTSNWFAFSAAVETPLLLSKSSFVSNALLMILAALPAVDALLRLRRPGRLGQRASFTVSAIITTVNSAIAPPRAAAKNMSRMFLAGTLIPLTVLEVDYGMASSLAPDPAVAILIVWSVALWIRSPRVSPLILPLACFAVTIKLSAAPMLGLAVAAMLSAKLRWRVSAAWTIGLMLGFSSLVFAVRGVWLTGTVAYPMDLGRLPRLPWTVPADIRLDARQAITAWARYGQDYQKIRPGLPWLANWTWRNLLSAPMLLLYSVAASGAIAGLGQKRQRAKGAGRRIPPVQSDVGKRLMVAMVFMLGGTIFWFATAPQIRFGYGWLSALAMTPLAWFGRSGWPGLRGKWIHPMLLAGVIALLLLTRIDRRLLKAPLVRWPVIDRAAVVDRMTRDGTVIHVAHGDDRVWNTPLPATWRLDPRLRVSRDRNGVIRMFSMQPAMVK